MLVQFDYQRPQRQVWGGPQTRQQPVAFGRQRTWLLSSHRLGRSSEVAACVELVRGQQ